MRRRSIHFKGVKVLKILSKPLKVKVLLYINLLKCIFKFSSKTGIENFMFLSSPFPRFAERKWRNCWESCVWIYATVDNLCDLRLKFRFFLFFNLDILWKNFKEIERISDKNFNKKIHFKDFEITDQKTIPIYLKKKKSNFKMNVS